MQARLPPNRSKLFEWFPYIPACSPLLVVALFWASCSIYAKNQIPDPILFEGRIMSINSQTMIGFNVTNNKTETITHCLGYDISTPGSKTTQYIPQCDCNYTKIFEHVYYCLSKAGIGNSITFTKYFVKDGDPYFSYDMEEYESKRTSRQTANILFIYIPSFIAGIALLTVLASKWIHGYLSQFPYYERNFYCT